MPESRPQALETLFHRAAGLPPRERGAFLDASCAGDPELRAELEALLRQHAGGTRDYLQQPQLDPGPVTPVAPPTDIGKYHILEVLGEGGMGTVYRAEQRQDVRREVALKVIKAGMDTCRVVKRFETERQALARLDHPGIAHIYDAGSTDAGRPFFVMELVQGESLIAFCDAHALSLSDRLRLFRRVCEAVEHAHGAGVVHRDLKPSNVMVAARHGEPEPKVIDFGIARVGGDAGATQHTLAGEVVGTLDYMSPEQAVPGQADVDHRSDVYSLGAILYELLCGARPYGDALRTASLADAQAILRFKDVVPPSTWLGRMQSSAAAELRQVLRARRCDVATMQRQLRRDLDWIVLKALDKDPERRYATAAELAADVGRYLRHEPVQARPPSRVYRFTRFVRRNRLVVTAVTLVAVVAILGGAGTALGFLRAQRHEARADANETEAELLQIGAQLRRAVAASKRLVPAWPDKLAAMKAWRREQAIPLVQRLDGLRARLRAMQARGDEYTAEARERDRWTHPEAEQLALIESWIRSREETARRRPLTAAELGFQENGRRKRALLASRVEMRRTCTMPTPDEQLLHDAVVQLVLDLEAFHHGPRGAMRRVAEDLVWAAEVRRLTLDGDAARAWARARAAIKASDRYGALDLEPQVGLLPLGENPATGLWEFLHLRSHVVGRPRPGAGAYGRSVRPDEWCGIVFVLLPGGGFDMGSQGTDPQGPNYDATHRQDEGPVHRVRLAPFFLGTCELTRAQWIALTVLRRPSARSARERRAHDAANRPDRPPEHDRPVQGISWLEARRVLGGFGLELPTEAQWEYACRGGTDTPWYTGRGRASLRGHANFDDVDGPRAGAARVGSFAANPFGLFDVCGNLTEWCRDTYGPYTPERAARDGDGLRPRIASEHRRVLRGGSHARSEMGRSARRFMDYWDAKRDRHGIRPVRPVHGLRRARRR